MKKNNSGYFFREDFICEKEENPKTNVKNPINDKSDGGSEITNIIKIVSEENQKNENSTLSGNFHESYY